MFLFLNTAEKDKTTVALLKIKDDGFIVFDKLSSKTKSDKSLELIDKILKKNNLKPQKLQGFFVVKGPGPFTAVRIAIALANTFAYALKIPVIGVLFEEGKATEEMINDSVKNIKQIKIGEIVKPLE